MTAFTTAPGTYKGSRIVKDDDGGAGDVEDEDGDQNDDDGDDDKDHDA